MVYVKPTFRTKKDFIQAVETDKRSIVLHNPLGQAIPENGEVYVEGPQSTWYAIVELKDGLIVSIN